MVKIIRGKAPNVILAKNRDSQIFLHSAILLEPSKLAKYQQDFHSALHLPYKKIILENKIYYHDTLMTRAGSLNH